MDRITRFALKNAAVVVIIAVLLILGGGWSASQLKRETMPDIDIPVVAVVTPYPGAAPNDVYDNITKPVEQALSGVSGIDKVQSTSADSVSVVVAQFGYSADMDKAEANIKKAVDAVKLPQNAIAPSTKRISFGSSPILKVAISADGVSDEKLRSIARDTIVPGLKSVEGVGEANLASDAEYSVHIKFDPAKLRDKGLTLTGVTQQLQAANLSFPVGSVDIGDASQPVRVSGTLGTVDDLKNFDVAVYPNTNALFGDAFAQVGKGFSQLGSAVGQLGQGLGSLGSATGQLASGLGTVSSTLGKQVGLVAALQSTQSQLLDLKIQLSDAKITLADPGASAADKTAAQNLVNQLNATIPALEGAVSGIKAQLAAAQADALKLAQKSASAPKSSTSMPKASSSSAKSSTTSSKLDLKITLVKLSEVAEITYGPGTEVVGSRSNGKSAVLLDIIRTQDANTVDVSKGVRAEMDKLTSSLPSGAKVEYVYDASVGINASVNGMVREGLLGALFAFIVILLFLRNWRSTIIAVVSIPLSVLIAIVFLRYAGVTLNVMTLGGLTVAIGRVVDDSIVVIENIFRHLSRGDERTPETIRAAAAEVTSAITSSTLTTVAVFIPLGLVTGIIGKIFRPFALTVALSLLASLAVAVTVVPLMAKWLLMRAKVKHEEEGGGRGAAWYRRTLGWALDHKAIILGGSALLLAGSVALVPLIGTGFVPETKEKYVNITVEYPEGTKAPVVDATMRKIEGVLSQEKAVRFYDTSVGSAGGFDFSSGVTGTNRGGTFVKLDGKADTRAVVDELRDKLRSFETSGAKIQLSPVSVAGANSTIDVVVTGDSLADIRTAAEEITSKMRDLEGLENVSNNLSTARKQIAVDVDEKKAAAQGLNAAMVAGTIRSLVAEQSIGTMKVDGKDTKVMYALKLDTVATPEQVGDIMLDTPLGEKVKLSSIASVEQTESPVSVLTKDGAEYASVSAAITERDNGKVISNTKKLVAGLSLPKGVKVEVGGAAEQMNQSFQQLGIAMLVAVGAVYLVMVIAFGEAVAPLAIMFSLPLAVIGGLVGLFIARVPLDMPAMIGALMLIGIVVTNAIVLVDRVQQRRRAGFEMREALQDAGATRMRPILMTALATVFALVPMASGAAEGALISQSLAVVVIGGLVTSTALTLFVVPVAFALLEGWRERVLGRRHETPEPPAGGDAEAVSAG